MRTKQTKQELLTGYFNVGSVVPSYGGLDRVLGFDWNNGDWSVRVQAVNKDGTIDKNYPTPRIHATMPKFI